MSSLTIYQIVSALATFLTFYVLSEIGKLWQQYDLVRDLTWFFSIRGRTEKMIRGLITTRDVMYYLLIIFMFVSFTMLRIKEGAGIEALVCKSHPVPLGICSSIDYRICYFHTRFYRVPGYNLTRPIRSMKKRKRSSNNWATNRLK